MSFLCYFIITSYYSHFRFLVLLVAELVRDPKGYVFVNLLVKRHKVKQSVVKVYSYQHTLHIFVGMSLVIDDDFGVSEAVGGELVVGHKPSSLMFRMISATASR